MAAKSADAARAKAMTKTVVKKVSPNVKIIKAGSKPLTQSKTNIEQMIAKAKTKTPAVKAKAKAEAKSNVRYNTAEQARMRQSIMNATYREALKGAGYDTEKVKFNDPKPTAAQLKTANKAVNAAQAKLAAGQKAAKAAAKVRGGSGMRGPLSLGGSGGLGKIK
jgi:hypothetical protein